MGAPHLRWALALGRATLPEAYCAYDPEWGVDLADRWHALQHALVRRPADRSKSAATDTLHRRPPDSPVS